jgi:hypothetical protein
MTLGTVILFIGALVLTFDRHPIIGILCLIVLLT